MPKISQYEAVTTPGDTDVLVVVQGGTTKKVDLSKIKAYAGGSSSVPDPTAENDVLMGGGSPIAWVKKTINQLKTALGLGSAAYTNTTAYDASGAATSAVAGHESSYAHGNIPAAPTAENDILVGGGSPIGWIKKTLTEFKTILGLGTAAYTASTAYDAAGAAAAAAGVKTDKVATSPDPTGYVATFDSSGNLAVSAKTVSGIGNVSSEDFTTIVKCSQAEYDALSPVDENTLYIIVG
jgi:hypothetical protein